MQYKQLHIDDIQICNLVLSFLLITILAIIVSKGSNLMDKYPKMITLLIKNYSYEDDIYLLEVGRNCLQALVFQVIYENKLHIYHQSLVRLIPDIFWRQLKLYYQDQLLLFLGKRIFMSHHPDEKQVVKQTLLTILSKYNLPQLTDFSFIFKKKNADECLSESESCSIFEQPFSSQSQIDDNGFEPFSQTNSNFMQLQVQNQQINQSQLKRREIVDYLSTLSVPKTQLDQFCQTMKIKFPLYIKQKTENAYCVTAILDVKCFLTNFVLKRYEFKATCGNQKRAQNKASLGLLSMLWSDYPQIWRIYVEDWKKMSDF